MKLFAAAVALMGMSAMVSCSNEEPVNNGTGSESSQGDSYIRVNLCNVPDAGTRAGDNATFDAGSTAERTIRSIAFFFFDNNGNPFVMENNNITGTTDLTPSNKVKPVITLSSANQYAATLVLGKAVNEGWNGVVPAKMVAIANSKEDGYTSYTNVSLAELLDKVAVESSDKKMYTSGNFVMTSSTYGENGAVKYWTDIKLENIKKTPEEAIAAPVQIYLERIAAKVKVLSAPDDDAINANGDFIVATRPLYDADGNQVKKTFYAHINGWDLNATASQCNVFKNLDLTDIPFTGWNMPESFRSCWAKTNTEAQLRKSFNWEKLGKDMGTTAYCLENTRQPLVDRVQDAKTDATKVLISATIVDETGDPQDLVSWAGSLYLKTDFLNLVANHAGCDVDDIELIRSTSKDEIHHVSTWYYKNDGGNKTLVQLPEFDNIRVWEDGLCYYIINIRHTLENGKNIYGVVRNHSYQISIKSIAGLGTPGGPGDHENPENPDPELESFVAAQVNILNWHVISWDVNVES